jgi:hypothetical protein
VIRDTQEPYVRECEKRLANDNVIYVLRIAYCDKRENYNGFIFE